MTQHNDKNFSEALKTDLAIYCLCKYGTRTKPTLPNLYYFLQTITLAFLTEKLNLQRNIREVWQREIVYEKLLSGTRMTTAGLVVMWLLPHW